MYKQNCIIINIIYFCCHHFIIPFLQIGMLYVFPVSSIVCLFTYNFFFVPSYIKDANKGCRYFIQYYFFLLTKRKLIYISQVQKKKIQKKRVEKTKENKQQKKFKSNK